jgi:hypothetical protein
MTLRLRGPWAGWVGACVVALGASLSRSARAQETECSGVTITVNSDVPRVLPGGGPDPHPRATLDPTAINYQDCIDDLDLEFTVGVANLAGCSDTIQVWAGAGTDCTQPQARDRIDGAPQCWPVSGSLPLEGSFTTKIRAEDIVAHISDSDSPALPTSYTPASADNACRSQSAPGTVQLTLYFLAVNATTAVDAFQTYSLDGDLVGPYAPTSVAAGVGQNIIVVSWTPAVDSTIQGFNIYCQPVGAAGTGAGSAGATALVCPDAGTPVADGAASAVGGTSDAASCHYLNEIDSGAPGASSSCASPGDVLKNVWTSSAGSGGAGSPEAGTVEPTSDGSTEGSAPESTAVGISDIPSQYLCGQVGNGTSGFTVTNFVNSGAPIVDNTEYVVTVAAFDGTNNVGIIGNLACVIPSPVTDFLTAYVEAGGQAGGGFCSLRGAGMPISRSLFGVSVSAAAFVFARRRRLRRRR